MKLLKKPDATIKKEQDKRIQAEAMQVLSQKESDLIKDIAALEKRRSDLVEETANVFREQSTLFSEKIGALQAEVSELELRKRKALEPIEDLIKEAQVALDMARKREENAKKLNENAESLSDAAEKKLKDAVDNRMIARMSLQEIEKKKKELSEREVSIEISSREAQKTIEDRKKSLDEREKMIKNSEDELEFLKEGYRRSAEMLRDKEKDLEKREIKLKDRYDSLESTLKAMNIKK